MILHIIGTDGRCQVCGERGSLRHVDPDLGFVCTACFCELVMVGLALRQEAARHFENAETQRRGGPSAV